MTFAIAAMGVAIGVISGTLGAGPSILTVLLLKYLVGEGLHEAAATALVVVAVMSVVALVHYAREGAVVWRPAVVFGAGSMTAAFVAGHLAARVPGHALLVVLLGVMVVAALGMLVPPRVRPREPREGEGARGGAGVETPRSGEVHDTARASWAGASSVGVLLLSGVAIGTLTGLVGVGGGFAVVPLLVIFARAPMRSAIGASLLVIAVNTVAGFAGHLPHPPVDWSIALYLGATEAAGSMLGARLSRRMSAGVLRRSFACLMLVAAILVLGQSVFTLRLP